MSPPRNQLPSILKILDYWVEGSRLYIFPDCMIFAYGTGEPLCFRCGLCLKGWDWEWTWTSRSLGSWLHRAHLHDHRHGGLEDVSNLVPLCWLCHYKMPESLNRTMGIDYVNEKVQAPALWALYAGKRIYPNKRPSASTWFRLIAEYNELLRQRLLETTIEQRDYIQSQFVNLGSH